MAGSGRVLPSRVSLDVDGRSHAVFSFELSGHRACLTTPYPLSLDDSVRLQVGWSDGSSTTLPVRVRALIPTPASSTVPPENVAHVDVEGVEGDWRPFLAYLGPPALAS